MPAWSKEQLEAIGHTSGSLLVSAAAGSGKTATLAERCSHLVCSSGCPVTDLLVVTFTEEAAAEMKSRVEKALRERLASDPSSHALQRQLALLPGAQISTIHAFCARLLKQHFQAVELDPAFAVLDEQEAALLQREVAAELLEESFASRNSSFTDLIDLYADGRDARIEDQIIQTHNVLCSLSDPEQWRRNAMGRLKEVEQKPDFFQTQIGREFLALARQRIEQMIRHADSVTEALRKNPSSAGCDVIVQAVRDLLTATLKLLSRDFAAAATMVRTWSCPTLKSAPRCDDRDRAKELLDFVRSSVKPGGDIYELFSRDESQMRSEIIRTIAPSGCFLDLVAQFSARYAESKRQQHVVDFSDLEHLALRVLSDQTIARHYQDRFAWVMVDEFQDINALQWDLLHRVARKDAAGEPTNLFCVGDVKQSIYRFRLADPSIFRDRADDWRPKGRVIDMRHNFRSRKPLLDAINFIFRDLMKRDAAEIEYDESQELDGQRKFPPNPATFRGSPIELHLIPDHPSADDPETAIDDEEDLDRVEKEAAYTARLIQNLMASGKQVTERDGAARPLRFGDIAVLLRSAKFTIVEYSRAIAAMHIPVFAESRTGFFQASEVNDMLSILKLLDNQQQDIPMAAVLRSPVFAITKAEDALARIRIAHRDLSFHAATVLYAREGKDALAGELKRVLATLERWRERSLLVSVADLLWEIFTETGYIEFCQALDAGAQRVANLMYLHRCARKFTGFRQQGLFRFLEYIKQLEERSDLGQPSPGEPGNAVRVMTVHGSKGLEFPVVIVSGLNAKWNLSDGSGAILVNREKYLAASVADEPNNVRYPSVATWLAKDQIRRASLAEELRVLYVAMTRAQEHLVLIGTCGDKQLAKWKSLPSPGADPVAFGAAGSMLQWLIPLVSKSGGQLEIVPLCKPIESTKPAATDAVEEQLEPELWTFRYPQEPLTRQGASTSVTGLSKGDERPVTTPDPTADAGPAAGEEARERGIAVHLLMEHYDFSPKAPAPADQLKALVAHGVLTASQAAHIDLDDVQWLISSSSVSSLLSAPLVREVPMLDNVVADDTTPSTELDRVLLRGRIDAIAQTGAGLVVVDYKTDRIFPEAGSEREQAYRKQMDLYRNAIERSGLGHVAGVKLVFLRARRVLEV